MRVDAIDHIHFLVPDLERARALFGAVAGEAFSERYGGPRLNAWAYYHNRGSLDLFEPIDLQKPILAQPVGRYGIAGFALRVGDLDAALPRVGEMGLRVRSRIGSEEFGFGKVLLQAQLEPEDTYGMLVEIVQRGLPDDPLYCAFPDVVDHLEIHVRDLSHAVALFGRLTGRPFSPPRIDPALDATVSICDLGLRIVQPGSPDSPVARDLDRFGEGVRAIAFSTADIHAVVVRAGALGLHPLRRSPGFAEFAATDFDALAIRLIARKAGPFDTTTVGMA